MLKKLVLIGCLGICLVLGGVGCSKEGSIPEGVSPEDFKVDSLKEILSYNTDLKSETKELQGTMDKWINGDFDNQAMIDKLKEFQDKCQENINKIDKIVEIIDDNKIDLSEKDSNIIKYTKKNFEDMIKAVDLVIEAISEDNTSNIEKAKEIINDVNFSVNAMEQLDVE